MKATGIVRRIDDLGRVVIPKEIRRTMRIREGDPLEIYTDREGEVIFKKYSPIGELSAFAAQYAETLHKTCGLAVVICDRDAVITVAGLPRREFADKPLSHDLEALMESRSLYTRADGDTVRTVLRDSPRDGDAVPDSHTVSCAMPIVADGDVVGCVVSTRAPDRPLAPDIESKLIQTAANFLGKQLEA